MKATIARFVLGLCLALASSTLFSSVALAAPPQRTQSVDPVVVVARDDTTASHCVMTDTVKHNDTIVSTTTYPCLPGTVVATFQVRLSEATARHEPYVPIPSAGTSAQVRANYSRAVATLVTSVQNAILQSRRGSVVPQIPCGDTGDPSALWSPSYNANITFLSDVQYLHTADCRYAYIEESHIRQYNNQSAHWDDDRYGGSTWTFVCQWSPIQTDPNYNVDQIDSNQTLGFYFVEDTTNSCFGGSTASIALGPLN